MTGKVLTIGESDSCGASGLQADIKTILALGGYAMTAVAAVAAQNTKGIAHIEALEPWFVEQQMRIVLEDTDIEDTGNFAIKVGTLVNADIIGAVADVLDSYQNTGLSVIVDPSIIVRSGSETVNEQIMDEDCFAELKRRLFIRAHVLTPSLREAELLTGMTIRDMDDMRHAADMMRTLGAESVLLKAGTAAFAGGDKTIYLLATEDGETVYERPPIDATRTLGLGATLASAIAISCAQGMSVHESAERAIAFLHGAAQNDKDGKTAISDIGSATISDSGSAARPLNHAFSIEQASLPKRAKA